MKKRNLISIAMKLVSIVSLVAVVGIYLLTLLGPNPGDYPPTNICTMIGCSDSLWVHLTGELPQSYTIKAANWFSFYSVTIDCPNDQDSAKAWCKEDGAVFFSDPRSIPNELTITVTWEGHSKTETFKPVYSTYRPNGPDCEPECLKSDVTVELP